MYAARGLGGRKLGAHHAAQSMVDLLLHHNASLSVRDKDDHTALMWACWSAGSAHAIQPFISHCRETTAGWSSQNDKCIEVMNARNKLGITALMLVARYGKEDAARMLLKNHAEVDDRSRMNETALMMAAERGHAALAKVLIESGADVNARDARGVSVSEKCTSSHAGCRQVMEVLHAATQTANETTEHVNVLGKLEMSVWALWGLVKPWLKTGHALMSRWQ
jgi:hypothetical protein